MPASDEKQPLLNNRDGRSDYSADANVDAGESIHSFTELRQDIRHLMENAVWMTVGHSEWECSVPHTKYSAAESSNEKNSALDNLANESFAMVSSVFVHSIIFFSLAGTIRAFVCNDLVCVCCNKTKPKKSCTGIERKEKKTNVKQPCDFTRKLHCIDLALCRIRSHQQVYRQFIYSRTGRACMHQIQMGVIAQLNEWEKHLFENQWQFER